MEKYKTKDSQSFYQNHKSKLKIAGGAIIGAVLGFLAGRGCQPEPVTIEKIVKEEVQVEKIVEKPYEVEKIVEKEVIKYVDKEVPRPVFPPEVDHVNRLNASNERLLKYNGHPVKYDGLGRVKEIDGHKVKYDFKNRVKSLDGHVVRYDSKGRVIRANGHFITYDDSGKPTANKGHEVIMLIQEINKQKK